MACFENLHSGNLENRVLTENFRGSGSSAATSAQSRLFDRTSAASSASISPVDASRKVGYSANTVDSGRGSRHVQENLPPRAHTHSNSQGYLDFQNHEEDDEDFGDIFKGFNRRSTVLDDSALTRAPAPVVLRTVSTLSSSHGLANRPGLRAFPLRVSMAL